MSKLTEEEEHSNFLQLSNFRRFWRQSPEYPRKNDANNVVEYPVIVSYTCVDPTWDRTFTTIFRVYVGSGFEDGVIDLVGATGVTVEAYHLRFSPSFQKYSFEIGSGSLMIIGSSPKMGGAYNVSITPSIERPSQ